MTPFGPPPLQPLSFAGVDGQGFDIFVVMFADRRRTAGIMLAPDGKPVFFRLVQGDTLTDAER